MEQGGKILIVDDEFSVRDSLSRWLTKDGYDVTDAENGELALQKLEKQEFDVAILDINSGENVKMNGQEVHVNGKVWKR